MLRLADDVVFEQHLILDYDEYWFQIDEYRKRRTQILFAHLWVEKFTPSIFRRILREWLSFRQVCKASLYAVCDDGDQIKWEKFVRRLGFIPTGRTIFCENGAERPLFISTVSNEHEQTNNVFHAEPKDVSVGTAGLGAAVCLQSGKARL